MEPGSTFSIAVDEKGREVNTRDGAWILGWGSTKRGQLVYDQRIRDEALDRGPHQKGAGQTVVTIEHSNKDVWNNVDTGDALGSGDDIGNVTEETSGDVAGI
jgi:predicted transcriptional regulator